MRQPHKSLLGHIKEMKSKSAAKGFLLAPIIISALFSFFATATGLISGLGHSFEPNAFLNGGLVWFLSALLISYIASAILGVPGYLLFKNKSINSLQSYLIGGAFLGLILPLLLTLFVGWSEIISMGWKLFITSAIFGAATSYFFWLISIKSPNK